MYVLPAIVLSVLLVKCAAAVQQHRGSTRSWKARTAAKEFPSACFAIFLQILQFATFFTLQHYITVLATVKPHSKDSGVPPTFLLLTPTVWAAMLAFIVWAVVMVEGSDYIERRGEAIERLRLDSASGNMTRYQPLPNGESARQRTAEARIAEFRRAVLAEPLQWLSADEQESFEADANGTLYPPRWRPLTAFKFRARAECAWVAALSLHVPLRPILAVAAGARFELRVLAGAAYWFALSAVLAAAYLAALEAAPVRAFAWRRATDDTVLRVWRAMYVCPRKRAAMERRLLRVPPHAPRALPPPPPRSWREHRDLWVLLLPCAVLAPFVMLNPEYFADVVSADDGGHAGGNMLRMLLTLEVLYNGVALLLYVVNCMCRRTVLSPLDGQEPPQWLGARDHLLFLIGRCPPPPPPSVPAASVESYCPPELQSTSMSSATDVHMPITGTE